MMSLEQISDLLDIKLRAFNMGIQVDEYEKSVYLSEAQKQVYYDLIKQFETSAVLSRWLEPYLIDGEFTNLSNPSTKVLDDSFVFMLDEGVEKIVFERAIDVDGKTYKIKPVRLDAIEHTLNSPFRQPNENIVIRVLFNQNAQNRQVELISINNLSLYKAKYFKSLKPIILEDLPDNLTIDGEHLSSNSLFPEDVVKQIIDMAAINIKQDVALFAQQQQ